MMYMSMNVAGEGLELAMLKFYRNYRLADVYASVDAMPDGAADMLSLIEGVEVAEARYVFEARAEVEGSDEIITLRLISEKDGAVLNRLSVTGNPLLGESDVLLNTTFYNAHGMAPGSPVTIFSGGRGYVFNACGTAMSPEYAYITRGGTDLLPDETGFGIGYISAESMGKLTGSTGVANDVVFALSDGYTFDDVRVPLEDALTPYGLNGLIKKEDQVSYSFLKMEIDGIRSVGSALPMVFVLMATIVLYLMMKRVIEQERTQIGTLKALGYSNTQTLLHYLSYGAITGLAGGALGLVGGYAASGLYLSMFLDFFMLPEIPGSVDPKYIAGAFIMAVGGGVAGAFFGAVKTMRLTPSEAMRPENPRPIKRGAADGAGFLRFILTSRGSMAVRGIARNRMRSVFVVTGVTFSFGLLTLCGGMDNIVDKLIMAQFTEILVYGAKVTLIRPAPYGAAVGDVYAINHVTRAEGLLELPVLLRHRHLYEGAVLTGIEKESILYKITDTNKLISYPPPEEGIILSNGLAAKLGAEAGDVVAVSSPMLAEDIPVAVSRVVEQNLGGGCYMELGALSAMFDMPPSATALLLDTDSLPHLKESLKGGKNVSTIEDKDGMLQKYRDMLAMFSSIYLFLQIMCAAVAFAIIYNTATISLSERKREYATLRVLGMTVNEVCEIMNLEYWLLGAAGMVLGVPFAIFLNNAVNSILDTSMMSIPSSLPPNSYIIGVVGCAAAIMLSNFSAKRRIRQFDMVEVLKERE